MPSFTNLNNVRLFLNKEDLLPQEVAVLSLLIKTVDGVVKNYCGWEILAADYVKKFSGTGSRALDLQVYPMNAVSLVYFDDEDFTDDVLVNDEEGIIYFADDAGISFTPGYRNISVEFNAGYPKAPADLVHASSWLVAMYFNRVDLENIGVQQEKFNQVEVEYDNTDLPPLVQRVLDRYRVLHIL